MKRRDFMKTATALSSLTITSMLLKACTQSATEILVPTKTQIPTIIQSSGNLIATQVLQEPTAVLTAETSEPTISTAKEEIAHETVQPRATITPAPATQVPIAKVALVRTTDRAMGIEKAIDLVEFDLVKNHHLFLKPNFNSADPYPGSTHNDTLSTLIKSLYGRGAGRITVGDRSGMGDTRAVMEQKGIFGMAYELDFDTVVFDELEAGDWEILRIKDGHWTNGFAFARPVLEADGIIQTCNLKTHRYGGDFTLSLKNSVGLVAKWIPGDSYNYMSELHSSPHQRQMIAEINLAYRPDLIIMDGIQAFVDGGPDRGTMVNSQVILAGYDRVAIDAVGVAILRMFGTTPAVSNGPIFQQEQIARAVELNLGVTKPDQIEIVTDDLESAEYAKVIMETILKD